MFDFLEYADEMPDGGPTFCNVMPVWNYTEDDGIHIAATTTDFLLSFFSSAGECALELNVYGNGDVDERSVFPNPVPPHVIPAQLCRINLHELLKCAETLEMEAFFDSRVAILLTDKARLHVSFDAEQDQFQITVEIEDYQSTVTFAKDSLFPAIRLKTNGEESGNADGEWL